MVDGWDLQIEAKLQAAEQAVAMFAPNIVSTIRVPRLGGVDWIPERIIGQFREESIFRKGIDIDALSIRTEKLSIRSTTSTRGRVRSKRRKIERFIRGIIHME